MNTSVVSVSKALNEKREYEKLLTEYTDKLRKRSKEEYLDIFADRRNFKVDTLKRCGIFYIGEMEEMLLPEYLEIVEYLGVISNTNKKPIFKDRYVIPILNKEGMVQNLVGYSFDANERYVYGTGMYYRRADTLWGEENLETAYKMGYAILVEGITDAIRLREMGYENSFAMCGTHKSEYIIRSLNRCEHGIIRIPDRDNAGKKAVKGWEGNRHITINVYLQYKDIDEMCRESEENREWFNSYMNGCIDWIKQDKHMGQQCECEEITII